MTIVSELPEDIFTNKITPTLSIPDLSRLARSCKTLRSLLAPTLMKEYISLLLRHVVFGEQNQVEKIIQKNPSLILKKGDIIDYSNRTFINISPWQYAAWALDTHMLKIFLKYIPEEEKLTAISQLNDLKEQGTNHGRHYNFSLLKSILIEYKNNYFHWNSAQFDSWYERFGEIQKGFPVHLVNEYCHPDRSFNHIPDFKNDTLPREMSFYYSSIDDKLQWFPLSSNYNLGSKIILYRGAGSEVCAVERGMLNVQNIAQSFSIALGRDLKAITKLYEVRSREIIDIRKHLLNYFPREKLLCNIL